MENRRFPQRWAALQIPGNAQRVFFHRPLRFGDLVLRRRFGSGRPFFRWALPKRLESGFGLRRRRLRPGFRRHKRLLIQQGLRLRCRLGRHGRIHDGGLIKRRAAIQLSGPHHHRRAGRMGLGYGPGQTLIQRDRLKGIVRFPALLLHGFSSFPQNESKVF